MTLLTRDDPFSPRCSFPRARFPSVFLAPFSSLAYAFSSNVEPDRESLVPRDRRYPYECSRISQRTVRCSAPNYVAAESSERGRRAPQLPSDSLHSLYPHPFS